MHELQQLIEEVWEQRTAWEPGEARARVAGAGAH